MGTDNKTPEYLKKNPLGKVPVLDTPQGAIWESNAIARYGMFMCVCVLLLDTAVNVEFELLLLYDFATYYLY